MTVTNIEKDLDQRTLTVTAEFTAPVEQVWQMWEDPRLLEQWWGPPTHPATVVEHDLTPGGRVAYYMTGPEGERYNGWWKVVSVDPPHGLELDDGFSDADGNPVADLPVTRMRLSLTSESSDSTTMVMESVYDSLEAMEQVLAMGMEEGIRSAIEQIDALLRTSAEAT